jgi:hypothetical protein
MGVSSLAIEALLLAASAAGNNTSPVSLEPYPVSSRDFSMKRRMERAAAIS